jgi:predicted hotdog family 3-hydroxylacyl-ACP dehydratase
LALTDNISAIIPQRAPFVMIDALESCTPENASTSFTVRADNIFVAGGILQEAALVENIAQTAAAHMGYTCQQENKPVPVGFIGAVQNLVIHALPAVNDELRTEIIIKNQVFNATIIAGTIILNGRLIAGCEMKIFIS